MMQEYWITEYGAVADGVTNCAAAIQAAVSSLLPSSIARISQAAAGGCAASARRHARVCAAWL